MPLLDHFRPPLAPVRSWASFLNVWSASVCDWINTRVPAGHFAEMVFRPARYVEREVADVEPTAKIPPVFSPPMVFGDCGNAGPKVRFASEIAVEVFDADRRLLGVVEFVGQDTKADHECGYAFACKLITHLSRGIGVVVVDIVTSEQVNLHQAWADMTDGPEIPGVPRGETNIYAVSYRPRMEGESPVIDVWARPLDVGQPLPEPPLGLKGYGCTPVDLDATYTEACERSGLV